MPGTLKPRMNPFDALLVPPALVKRALDDLHDIAEIARRYAGMEEAVSARVARAEEELVPEEGPRCGDPPGDGRGRDAGGPQLREPALELLRRRLSDSPAAPGRELSQVATVGIDGPRRPPGREQRQEAVEIRIGGG